MTDTRTIEEVRLANLKFLHGSAANFGAPTSGELVSFLKSKKMRITEQQLSDIYHRKKNIDMILALSIEKAFCLPSGWLSEDQSYFLKISPEERVIFKEYARLPETIKAHILEIIRALNEQGKQQSIE